MECLNITINDSLSNEKQDLIKKVILVRLSDTAKEVIFQRRSEEDKTDKTFEDVIFSEVTNADIQTDYCGFTCNWIEALERSVHKTTISLTDMTKA